MIAVNTLALCFVVLAQTAPQPPAAPAAPGSQQPTPPAPPESQADLPPSDAPAPAAPSGEKLGEISLEDWSRDDWMLVQPKLALFELDGYFRMRGDLFRKLDFDNETSAEGRLNRRYQNPSDNHANFTSTNMRLRISPTINVSDNIHIDTTIDVFDNLVLGTTPYTPYRDANNRGLNILARDQEPVERDVNSLSDSAVIKRAYARVTALNEQLELRFGRMPSNWALGMMTNSGDCLDCDYGDVVDRLQVSFKVADILFIPAYDWVSTGPTVEPFGRSGGQAFDAVTWDDVEQYSLRVQRADAPEDIRERLASGESVFNYGAWLMYRRQFRDTAQVPTVIGDWPSGEDVRRNANLFTGDGYLKLHLGALEIGTEAAVIWGSFVDDLDPQSAGDEKTTVFQLGGVLELTYRFGGDYKGTHLGLKAGGASGDGADGYGAFDAAGTQRNRFDKKLANFQFSPDYHVDLLMFRQIIGTVTDAWYVRPEVSHTFSNNVSGTFGAVYSQALFRRSTPGNKRPMGLEINSELAFGMQEEEPTSEAGSFKGAIAGGLLFPFGAFKNLDPDGTTAGEAAEGGSFAWTIQGRLYVTF